VASCQKQYNALTGYSVPQSLLLQDNSYPSVCIVPLCHDIVTAGVYAGLQTHHIHSCLHPPNPLLWVWGLSVIYRYVMYLSFLLQPRHGS